MILDDLAGWTIFRVLEGWNPLKEEADDSKSQAEVL